MFETGHDGTSLRRSPIVFETRRHVLPSSQPDQDRPLPKGFLIGRRWVASERKLSRIFDFWAQDIEGISADDRAGYLVDIRTRLTQGRGGDAAVRDALCLLAALLDHPSAGLDNALKVAPSDMHSVLGMLSGAIVEHMSYDDHRASVILAAALAALAGLPVHVIVASGSIARQAHEACREGFESLGLRSAAVDASASVLDRQEAYGYDVVFVSAGQLIQDHLVDRGLLDGRPSNALRERFDRLAGNRDRAANAMIKALGCGIFLDTDITLLDEGRLPVSLWAQSIQPEIRQRAAQALAIAARLDPSCDFTLDMVAGTATLTDQGKAVSEELTFNLSGLWRAPLWRNLAVSQALNCLHLMRSGTAYVISSDGFQLTPQGRELIAKSGEAANDWRLLIALKESLEGAVPGDQLARIGYQRFFNNYRFLGGLVRAGIKIDDEVKHAYGLTPKPGNGRNSVWLAPPQVTILPDRTSQTAMLISRISERLADGRPVLMSLRDMTRLTELKPDLQDAGLTPQVIAARDEAQDAAAIAAMVEPGTLTIVIGLAGHRAATNPDRAPRADLQLIFADLFEEERMHIHLFKQFIGHGVDQSAEIILSRDDPVLKTFAGLLDRRALRSGAVLTEKKAESLIRSVQARAHRANTRLRGQVHAADLRYQKMLAFTGRQE